MAQNHHSPSERTPLERKFERALSPFQRFVGDQTTSSMLLLVCLIAALVIANSPWAHDYQAALETPLGLVFGEHALRMDLRHWINEGLMTLFFFLLGLEIKRELLVGELQDVQRSLPVIFAALGGMLAPAFIYYALNAGGDYVQGWGIPMATDTAFAVGVLALLRRHIPPAVVTFLTALAIIDDLGAILVIAVFYSQSISLTHLVVAGVGLLVLIGFNLLGIRRPSLYALAGLVVWTAMLGSGVHATVAGVLVAATIPARSKRKPRWFLRRTRWLVRRFQEIEVRKSNTQPMLGEAEQHDVAVRLQDAAEKATTPLRRWERFMDRPVSLFVMPVFALANAGIVISAQSLQGLADNRLTLGVIFGLLIGKGLGIPLFTWAALRLGLGRLPTDVNLKHIIGVGLLGGIGFTMSIFIAGLGFDADPQAMHAAKAGILTATLAAGVAGYLWLRWRG